jgi:hypothetical protein
VPVEHHGDAPDLAEVGISQLRDTALAVLGHDALAYRRIVVVPL